MMLLLCYVGCRKDSVFRPDHVGTVPTLFQFPLVVGFHDLLRSLVALFHWKFLPLGYRCQTHLLLGQWHFQKLRWSQVVHLVHWFQFSGVMFKVRYKLSNVSVMYVLFDETLYLLGRCQCVIDRSNYSEIYSFISDVSSVNL